MSEQNGAIDTEEAVTTNAKSAELPRYAVWNNKGGVGKTFLTFAIATEYAATHPDETVVVIDMCPQANVSEILLGGNGTGSSQLEKLLGNSKRQSIGGYFDERIRAPHAKSGTEISVLFHASSMNSNLPSNVFIVAGDPSLEIQTQAINQIAAQTLPKNAWKNVHTWVTDLITSIKTQHPSSIFFIDCNPSFSAYTELALVAANRLIIPCTADGSSARAIDNIGQLLFGARVPSDYSDVNFAKRAENAGIALPSIHLIPLNRSTQFDKKAAKAFGAMYDEIKKRARSLYKDMPNVFSTSSVENIFMDVPDAHSVSVVASHNGMPLRALKVRRYDIYGTDTQVNSEPLNRYKTAITHIVEAL